MMKIFTAILLIWLSITFSSTDAAHWESTGVATIKQDDITMTETITPTAKEHVLSVTLEGSMKDERWQLQDAPVGQQEILLLSPLVIAPSPPKLSREEAQTEKGRLLFRLCKGVRFVDQQLPATVIIHDDQLYWQVEEAMQEEKTNHVQLSFLIEADPHESGYQSESGHIIQLYSDFIYVKAADDKQMILQKMVVPSGKIRYWY